WMRHAAEHLGNPAVVRQFRKLWNVVMVRRTKHQAFSDKYWAVYSRTFVLDVFLFGNHGQSSRQRKRGDGDPSPLDPYSGLSGHRFPRWGAGVVVRFRLIPLLPRSDSPIRRFGRWLCAQTTPRRPRSQTG